MYIMKGKKQVMGKRRKKTSPSNHPTKKPKNLTAHAYVRKRSDKRQKNEGYNGLRVKNTVLDSYIYIPVAVRGTEVRVHEWVVSVRALNDTEISAKV